MNIEQRSDIGNKFSDIFLFFKQCIINVLFLLLIYVIILLGKRLHSIGGQQNHEEFIHISSLTIITKFHSVQERKTNY